MPYFINKSVVWLGMVNNANRTISHILHQLNQVSCIFKNSFFLFFESNSKDETPQILKNWSKNLTQLHMNDNLSTLELKNRYLMQKYCNQLRYRGRRKTNIIESYKELDVIESIHNHMPNMIKKSIIMGDDLVKKDLEYEEYSRSNATYHHTLSRVERFVQYRNMLLHETYMSTGIDLYVKQSGSSITNIFSRKVKQESALMGSVDMDALRSIDWDYVIIIDLDVWEIDFVSFFSELKDCPYSVMCINGVDKEDEYRDSFATVELNHNWIHRPFIFNRSDRYYEKARHILRKKMPRKNQRYEEVKSCFNGLAAYRMSPRDLYNSHCEYYLNNEINAISMKSNGTVQWVHDIARLVAWNDLKGPMYDIFAGYEWHLCEHIPFHYCLGDYGYDISISSNAKLYYYPLSPPVTAEERRTRRRERSRRRRRRRAESRARAALNHGKH